MICNICNHILPEDSEFCQYCGNRIEKEYYNGKSPIEKFLANTVEREKHEGHGEEKKLKKEYCRDCGALIDYESKICSGCGKKYFRGIRVNKFVFTVMFLSLTLLVSVIFNIVQFREIDYLNERVSYWEEKSEKYQQTIIDLKSTNLKLRYDIK